MNNARNASADRAMAASHVLFAFDAARLIPDLLLRLLRQRNAPTGGVDTHLVRDLVIAACVQCNPVDELIWHSELDCARFDSLRLFQTKSTAGIDVLVILDQDTGIPSEPAQSIESDALRSLSEMLSNSEVTSQDSADAEVLNEHLTDKLLCVLPFAATVPPAPMEKMNLENAEFEEWLEEQLIKKGLPVADAARYVTSPAVLCPDDSPVQLVCYTPRPKMQMLQRWISWAQFEVPNAFDEPLRSTVPQPLTPARVRTVAMSLADVIAATGLHDIEPAPDTENRVSKDFAQFGTEAIGWYQPYHRFDKDHWGIYLHSGRILDLGHALRERLRPAYGQEAADSFSIATRLILEHEFFHARLETFALGQEVSLGRPVFRPYSDHVYKSTIGTRQACEEAIANYFARQAIAELLASLRSTQGWSQGAIDTVIEFVDEIYELSPPGYRHWYLAAEPDIWRRLAGQVINGEVELQREDCPLEPLLHSVPSEVIELGDVPIWMTNENGIADRLFSTPTRREVERLLKKRGYFPRPGKGSHMVWQSNEGQHFTLPAGNSLSRLVFRNLLHHLGMTKESYLAVRATI
jgi:predicted RNA binding protein YcfA (HicA-like mRNA interferase family)